MSFTASKDKEYGDCYFDIFKTEKKLIRATLKTYENTGTYVFLKLIKRKDKEYEIEQRISLTTEKFDKLMKKVAGYETRCQKKKEWPLLLKNRWLKT